MEVLFVLIVLLILLSTKDDFWEWISRLFDFSDLPPTNKHPPLRRYVPPPVRDVSKIAIKDLPVNLPILSHFVELQESEDVVMAKKSLCRKCNFLEGGFCTRGEIKAPKIYHCSMFLNKKSSEAAKMRREEAELEKQAIDSVGNIGCTDGEDVSFKPLPKGLTREEVIKSSFKD